MNKKLLYRLTAIVIVLIVSLYLFTGCSLIQLLNGNISTDQKADFLLNKVYDYIKNKYVDELTDEQLEEIISSGANEMLSYYDKYGYFLTPEQYYNLLYPSAESYEGEYFGFTFTQEKYLGLKVHEIYVDSKAYGLLQEGDIIVDIKNADGTPITYNDGASKLNIKVAELDIITEVLKEKKSIIATVIRGGTLENVYEDGEVIEVVLTKGIIDKSAWLGYEHVEYYFGKNNTNLSQTSINLRNLASLDGTDIGYIRIKNFSYTYDDKGKMTTDTAEEVFKALNLMKNSGKTQLILDLKGNPGGSVDEVTNVAKFFIYNGANNQKLLVTTLKDRKTAEHYSVNTRFTDYFSPDQKIVVLADGGSASASELLLGAMLDYGTAIYIGETTFGKGIAQYISPILKGSFERDGKTIESYYAIYYTAAYYYTPQGTNIHGKGFTPSSENIATDYVTIMQRAKEVLK